MTEEWLTLGDPGVVATLYWRSLPDGRVQCLLCPRECRLREGQRGLCFVRACLGGQVVLTTFGRSSGFCIDPIEKKPLNHFLPGTPVLSFGTAGCNLSCHFCQNWDISRARRSERLHERAEPELLAAAAKRLGCRSLAYTYNDPVVFLEYAIATARAARALGVRSVAVTAGYIHSEPAAEFFQWMDAVNCDLKSFSDTFYRRLCGGALQPVLETLEYIKHHTGAWLEITTLLIPGENDGDAEIEALSRWVGEHLGPEVPLHFSAFHPDYRMTHLARTPPATLSRAREIARRCGLFYVYTGNVPDVPGQSTCCHGCGGLLIRREGYVLTHWQLSAAGECLHCGSRCAGVFEGPPGNWGGRRQPVSFKGQGE
ncbi:MAG: AmmeMemoRadiSam system radical SAM enzyme [Magnetococcales bacterium]|nr:AmmeMemoRadiSam system radical SAM enzyme [Magnetococcales bacterium]